MLDKCENAEALNSEHYRVDLHAPGSSTSECGFFFYKNAKKKLFL